MLTRRRCRHHCTTEGQTWRGHWSAYWGIDSELIRMNTIEECDGRRRSVSQSSRGWFNGCSAGKGGHIYFLLPTSPTSPSLSKATLGGLLSLLRQIRAISCLCPYKYVHELCICLFQDGTVAQHCALRAHLCVVHSINKIVWWWYVCFVFDLP